MEHSVQNSAVRIGATVLQFAQDILWLLLVILTPLIINTWGQQPFALPKVILVRTLVWLLAGLILAEMLFNEQPPGAIRHRLVHALRANPLLGPVTLLAFVLVVTTATAIDWRLSLWGSYERGQGAVTLLTYLLLFVLAADRMQHSVRARLVVSMMVIAGAALILFSLLQAMGWNPLDLVSDARSPIYATLGRANFLGAYLAMLLPLTLALLLSSRQLVWRALWSALIVGELVVIVVTLARGAWLATVVSLCLFALLNWGMRLPRLWRRLAWSYLGLLFVSGPLTVIWLGPSQLDSIAARLAIWRATLNLIAQRPLLGYGADALGIVFPRVYPPQLVYVQGRHTFVDRAHNLLLDWTVIAGLPGLLAILLMLFIFVLVAWQALRHPLPLQKRTLLIAVLAAVLGNVANNLVSFDVTPTATATWLLMGMGIALAAPQPQAKLELNPSCKLQASRKALAAGLLRGMLYRWLATGVLLTGIGVAIWHYNIRPLLADIATHAAVRHAQTGDWVNAIAAGEQAVAYWPVEPVYYLLLSQWYWQRATAEPALFQPSLQLAERALWTARSLRAQDPAVWLHTAQFYTLAARQFGADTQALAEEAFRQTLTLSPNHATIYTVWGRAAWEDGQVAKAASLLRQAVALDATNGEAYLYLGAVELALGRLEIALADYREAVRLLPASGQAYAGLATAYWHLDQPQEALGAVDEALQRDPHNAQAITVRQEIYDAQ